MEGLSMKTPKLNSRKTLKLSRYELALMATKQSRQIRISEMNLFELHWEFNNTHHRLIRLPRIRQQLINHLILINHEIQAKDPDSLTNRMKRDRETHIKNRKQID